MNFNKNFNKGAVKISRMFWGIVLLRMVLFAGGILLFAFALQGVGEKHCKEGWAHCAGKAFSSTKGNFTKGLKDGKSGTDKPKAD